MERYLIFINIVKGILTDSNSNREDELQFKPSSEEIVYESKLIESSRTDILPSKIDKVFNENVLSKAKPNHRESKTFQSIIENNQNRIEAKNISRIDGSKEINNESLADWFKASTLVKQISKIVERAGGIEVVYNVNRDTYKFNRLIWACKNSDFNNISDFEIALKSRIDIFKSFFDEIRDLADMR